MNAPLSSIEIRTPRSSGTAGGDPTGSAVRPLVFWTTIEGTHTDGDGGDNEMWHWEEV